MTDRKRRAQAAPAPDPKPRCHARATAKKRWLTLYLICSLEAGHAKKHHDRYQWVAWDRTPDF